MKQNYITKNKIFKPPFRRIAAPTLGFGGAIFAIMQIITLVVDDPLPWPKSLFIGFGQFLLWFLLWTSISLPVRIAGLRQLRKQEKFLNFSFNDEMEKGNITNPEHICHQWFMSEESALVFHRDYICGIKDDEIIDVKGDGYIFEATLLTSENTKIKLKGLRSRVLTPIVWYIDGEPKNEKGEPENVYLRNLIINIENYLTEKDKNTFWNK